MHDPAAAPASPDFRALFEAAPGLFLVLDPEFVIVAANDAYARATATRREDILGRSIFAIFPDGEPAAELRASLQRVRDTGEADAMPVRQRGADATCWRLVNSPVRGGDGKLTYIVHRLEDVTDLVHLQRREEDAGARLKSADEALQRCIDDAQRFAYLVAHDLQSPLNAISGCIRLLKEECEGKLSEQGERYMGYVQDYAQRAQTLIRDLLAYSRLSSRTRAFAPTSLAMVLREAIDLAAARIGERGAEVVCGELPTLPADRDQMTQLLSNLIDNAIKFNRAEHPQVRIAAELRGEEWLFSVHDNGIGIEPRFHDEIFEVCRRLHSAQAYPGSGIGLACCQRIVAHHGGRIWVESQEGQGAIFFFTLPAEQL